ncbi:MAG: polyprenyl synthetase family protein, partial [Actinomycetota bacterium]|nr:polyprenyl synthetase family protein [Actinomycetota bacterium]
DPADLRLQELLSRPLPEALEHAEALALLRQHSALEDARVEARHWADHARKSLIELPAGAPRAALEQLCDYVVSRTG